MRIGWLSDIHLDFLDPAAILAFARELAARQADVWLLSGDIGTARTLAGHLRMLDAEAAAPIFFVLGNHDYYGSSLAATAAAARGIVAESKRLCWLTEAGPCLLDDHAALVGDDGWGDARFGNAMTTPVRLNDFVLIEDLACLSRADLVGALQRLGDEAATRLAPKLAQAAAACRRVVVVTHVPPFHEAAWHEGRPSDPDYAPWFACRAVGEAILVCARRHPEVQFLVLCGHTHGEGVYAAAGNVVVHTAKAEYGAPKVQRIFRVGPGTPSGEWTEEHTF